MNTAFSRPLTPRWSISKIQIALVVLIALAVLINLLLYLNRGIEVVIHNVGADPLPSVIVHVTGNSYPIGDIAAGATMRVRVCAKGESHVELEHDKGRKLVVGCYFESGYGGTITVDVTSEQVVRIDDKINIGPL